MGHNPLTPLKVMRNAHLLSTPCMSGVEQVPGLCGFLLSPTHLDHQPGECPFHR